MCEIKGINFGPRLFICNVILCEKHRQLNVNTNDCYVIVAFSVRFFCAPSTQPTIVGYSMCLTVWRLDCCRLYISMQWRLVVKMAGRAAKFHLWLNI